MNRVLAVHRYTEHNLLGNRKDSRSGADGRRE